MQRRSLLCTSALLGVMSITAPVPSIAQAVNAYPAKPIKLLVGVTAGGAADVFARLAGQKMGESLGQSFIVENKAGAGGTLAAEVAARAPADGYTLLVTAPTVMVVAPFLYKGLAFSPARDFVPITVLGGGPLVLVTHASVPAHNVSELQALARAKSGQITFGSGGQGTASHLSAELFAKLSDVKLLHIPYKGDGQAVNDLLSGQVQMMITGYNLVEPHIRSGRLRLLATTGRERLPILPQVPTLQETGLKGYESLGWIGLYAPAGTPDPIVRRLAAEWNKARQQPELAAQLAAMGMGALSTNSPEAFAAFQRAEVDRWSKVIADAGVKAD